MKLDLRHPFELRDREGRVLATFTPDRQDRCYLDLEQVAWLCRCNPRTVLNWMRYKGLTSAGANIFRLSDLCEWYVRVFGVLSTHREHKEGFFPRRGIIYQGGGVPV